MFVADCELIHMLNQNDKFCISSRTCKCWMPMFKMSCFLMISAPTLDGKMHMLFKLFSLFDCSKTITYC